MIDNYYEATAYNSQNIPPMPVQTHKAGNMPIYVRIPWGGNKPTTVDYSLFKEYSPKYLRRYYGEKYTYSWVGDERFGAVTHQFIRPDSIEGSCKFWGALYMIGIIGPPLSIFLAIFGTLFLYYIEGNFSDPFIKEYNITLIQYVVFPSIICFIIGYIIINYIPFLARRPGMGSGWELNRQTGMVTNFYYNKKDPGNPISTDSVPFYECDAYLWSAPDRYGLTHSLVLGHRYSKRIFLIGGFIGRVSTPSSVYAYWDMVQTYMDTSQPLLDIPVLEQFRALDPVTAEYDKNIGRDPHYFLNMDNAAWRKAKSQAGSEEITIQERHCLMQQHGVEYFPECKWT